MRTGILRAGAGLVGAIVLALGPVWAQELIPAKPTEVQSEPAEKHPTVEPLVADDHAEGHKAHGEEAHEPAEGGALSGLVVNGEYLLMRPRRNALDVAISNPSLVTLPVGPVSSLTWETRSGFRAGLGWRLPCDGWEVLVNYTHLDSSQFRTFTAPLGGTLLATLTQGGGNEMVGNAVGDTALQYNLVDLDVSKYCTVGDSFGLRFFGGGRLADIDQKFTVRYNGGALGGAPASVDSPVYFHGAGLTAGAEGTWKMWHGWGLYSRGRLGLVSGRFKTSLTETANSGQVLIVGTSEKYEAVIPSAELGAGVSWQNEHWRVAIGYELTNWFNMVNSLDFPSAISLGHVGRRTSDLTLEGLAVQLGVVF